MNGIDPAREFLRHTVATVAYRGAKAIRGAPVNFASFRIGETSRTPVEVLAHMGDLFDWALLLARGQTAWNESVPLVWDREVERFFATLRAFDDHLASEKSLGCSADQLFQGPIADALNHIGQLTMLRRLAGSPVKGENFFKADIFAGLVGRDQAAPRREFD